MKKHHRVNDTLSIGAAILLTLFIAALIVGVCCWTDSSMDFWLTHFKEVETNCPWYLSTVVTCMLNGLAIPFNIITEIVRLAL